MITGFENAGHKKLNANKVNVCKDEKNNHSFTFRKIKKGWRALSYVFVRIGYFVLVKR